MSIEEALAANTAVLIENTAAHANLAAVAIAAAGGKAAPAKTETKSDEDEPPKE